MTYRLTDAEMERFYFGERSISPVKGTEMAEGMFTPENDVTEERNGVQFLVAPKGIPIPMERAKTLGLVKEAAPTGPLETKADSNDGQPQINPDDLATVQGTDVTPGDLAADLETPRTIKKAAK